MGILSRWLDRWFSPPAPEAPDDIIPRIEQLLHGRALLDIKVSRSGKRYQSMLLGYNSDDGYIMLDEPFPVEQGAFVPGDSLEISSHDKQLRLAFRTEFISRQRLEGDIVIKVGLPREVGELQKRRSYRVAVRLGDRVRVELFDQSGTRHSAEVQNLSAEGFRIAIPGNVTDTFSFGQPSRDCLLRLGDTTIRCSAEPRNIEYLRRPAGRTILGARFHDISPRDQNSLNQFIAELQRQQRRENAEAASGA